MLFSRFLLGDIWAIFWVIYEVYGIATQLPIVLLGGIAGLLGSLIDSILGATFQEC